MDFRDFLGKTETLVLPYFGGTLVEAASRRLRVQPVAASAAPAAPGWYEVSVAGRRATLAAPASAPGAEVLDALPAVRGHWIDGWIFVSGRDAERVALPPDEEPAPLGRCTGRRWYGGEVVLGSIDFDDEAEEQARLALDALGSIADVKGAAPSLRAAYGFAVVHRVARGLGVEVSATEARAHAVTFADGGRAAAEAWLAHLVEARRRHEAEVAERLRRAEIAANEARHQARLAEVARQARARRTHGTPIERADAALAAAGARMIDARRKGANLEVTFAFMSNRFITVVDSETLQVYDAGICLAGADREVTLDSLPSVIREAIDEDHLNITRR